MDIKVSHPTQSFFLQNIYAPAHQQDNSLLWQSFPSLPPSPMFVCGDFNIATHAHDRWSSSPSPSTYTNPNLMNNLFPDLIDLASFSPSPLFTLFCNYSTCSSKSRIDFILASSSLLKPSHTSITFPIYPLSDHHAVILKSVCQYPSLQTIGIWTPKFHPFFLHTHLPLPLLLPPGMIANMKYFSSIIINNTLLLNPAKTNLPSLTFQTELPNFKILSLPIMNSSLNFLPFSHPYNLSFHLLWQFVLAHAGMNMVNNNHNQLQRKDSFSYAKSSVIWMHSVYETPDTMIILLFLSQI